MLTMLVRTWVVPRAACGGLVRLAGAALAPVVAIALALVLVLPSLALAQSAAVEGGGEGQAQVAQPFAPLTLSAAANFSQGLSPQVIAEALALGVDDFRDSLSWARIERAPGRYVFKTPRITYPDAIARAGGSMSLTVNWGNPHYDNGATPRSAEATAAQAAYVAALLKRFEAIHTVEVGNEFNGQNFVTGPVKRSGPVERAADHFAQLKPIHASVKAVDPAIKVLGGATHSMPMGYLWALLDLGAADYMDALAVHPYTTRPETFAKQVAVLRRHPAAKDLPLEVTEFGDENPRSAPAHLIKWVAVMAVSGVERAVWYPLNSRGDGFVPLIAHGGPTATGRAYAFANTHLAGRPARDVSPDAYTFAIMFGEDTLVLWGAPRAVTLAPTVRAFDVTGATLEGDGLTISPHAPIILRAQEAIGLGETVRLGDHGLLADSFYDFSYPDGEEGAPGPLERFARRDGQKIALLTMAGQERRGTVWVPYLGREELYPLRLTPRQLLPRGGRTPTEIVHRYTAPADGAVDVTASVAPPAQSQDGIAITVALNGNTLAATTTTKRYDFVERLELAAGDELDIAVGPNGTHRGDATRYRIRIGKPGAL